MVIIYDDPQPGEPAPVFMQPYLGEHAMLMNAEQAGEARTPEGRPGAAAGQA
ncbi:MAG: hypothetical protein M5R42_16195 [Rhodocyclaceae bacterium]|nr:hypothetical protein [Rhodocyclaceae bacterium]